MVPPADRRYVLVASELVPVLRRPDQASGVQHGESPRAEARLDDFNGHAGQHVLWAGVELGGRRAEHWFFSLGRAIIGGWLRMRRCSTLLDQTPSLTSRL
jgi:hypothetical protein